jgi:hypothetical protein
MRLYENIFLIGINILFVLTILMIFGITNFVPYYLKKFRNILHIYVALLLIFLYNPLTYKKREFKEFDRKVVFSSGVFLLLSSGLISYIEKYKLVQYIPPLEKLEYIYSNYK